MLHKPFSLHAFLGEVHRLAELCLQRDLCEEFQESDTALRHEMRNVAMIVSGSLELLHDAAGTDPVLGEIATRIERISQRGLDFVILQRLHEICRLAPASANPAFAKNTARIVRACEKGKAMLAEQRTHDAEKLLSIA